ncbi:hypothetical protein U062_01106 [Gammaproteobacteria bacterium MOLA455]|nr:hypothetical protein U062_01106 [Gammaproteobacteria bacterium MOLA455]
MLYAQVVELVDDGQEPECRDRQDAGSDHAQRVADIGKKQLSVES